MRWLSLRQYKIGMTPTESTQPTTISRAAAPQEPFETSPNGHKVLRLKPAPYAGRQLHQTNSPTGDGIPPNRTFEIFSKTERH